MKIPSVFLTLFCALSAQASTVRLASCTATVAQDENAYYGNAVGKTSDVTISYQEQPGSRYLSVQSTSGQNEFNLLGILPPTGIEHKVSFQQDATAIRLENCSRGFISCDPTFSMIFDKTSNQGTFTNYTRHCEPGESCATEKMVISVTCDQSISIPN